MNSFGGILFDVVVEQHFCSPYGYQLRELSLYKISCCMIIDHPLSGRPKVTSARQDRYIRDRFRASSKTAAMTVPFVAVFDRWGGPNVMVGGGIWGKFDFTTLYG